MKLDLSQSWQLYALGSAFFAALTAILGKIGVCGIDSNLAKWCRTIVIFLSLACFYKCEAVLAL